MTDCICVIGQGEVFKMYDFQDIDGADEVGLPELNDI